MSSKGLEAQGPGQSAIGNLHRNSGSVRPAITPYVLNRHVARMRRIENALACQHPNPWLKRLFGAVVRRGFGSFGAGNPTLIPCGVPSAPANADGPAALIRGADALVLSGLAAPARDRAATFAVPGQSAMLWALRGAGAILRGLYGKTAIFSEQRNPGGLPFPICLRCRQGTRCATALMAVAQALPAKSPKILKCGA